VTVNRTQLPPVGADPLFRFPAVDRHRLPTGLELRVVTHREVPVVTLMIVLPVGSSADPAGAFGLATLTSDLLDEGAGSRRAIDLHDALARIGAQLDIDTGYDATVISLVTLSRHLDRAIELLADIAFRPRFDPADVERVRTLRINRLRQLRDVPSARAEEAFVRHLFGDGHPYGHLPMGSGDALARLGPDDVRGFHGARFQVSRAVFVATGDVAVADLAEAIARVFPAGSDEASADEVATPRLDAACTPGAGRIVLIDRPGAPQSELRVGCVAAARSTADYHAMVTMNAVLGGQFVSRINLNLREQKGYTYGARSGFEFRRAPGPFSVQASVQTSATAESVREVLSELRGIGSERPVTAAELDLARASLTRGYPRNFETAEQLARAVAQLVVYGLPDDYYDRFVPTIRAVDERAVTRAAGRWIDPDRMSVVVVGDRAAVEQPLAALGLGEPIVDA
jgi:predicted Zn-dependent peptidase